jgi:hypothetical protein
MRQMVSGLLAIGLAGCVSAAADVSPGPADSSNTCNAAPAQSFVGQRADQTTGAAILKASGARTMRWSPPGSVATLDFREDRVNVQYDERLIIGRISCG